MNNNILLKYYNKFKKMINKKKFIIDKTGKKVVELLNVSIKLNPNNNIIDLGFRKTNENYCKKELNWYLSKSLSIINYVDDIKIWNEVCSKDDKKEINSNYGWCIFSDENYNQYNFCLSELKNNKESRRACMLYNRPSITIDYNKDGKSDYLCTNYVICFIRNNKLIYNIHQRSCDAIFGFFNDFYWHCYIYNKLYNDLKIHYNNLKIGYINYNIDSFHLYENHFNYLI